MTEATCIVHEGVSGGFQLEEIELAIMVPDRPKRVTHVYRELEPKMRKMLVDCLIKNQDIFT